MTIAQHVGSAVATGDGAFATLGMLLVATAVVLTLLAMTVRLDPAGFVRRRRHEQYVRRATAALLRDALRAQREHRG